MAKKAAVRKGRADLQVSQDAPQHDPATKNSLARPTGEGRGEGNVPGSRERERVAQPGEGREGRPSSLLDTRVIYCGDNLEQLAKLPDASVHDSQAAIPLAQLTAQRVTALYDLMASADDAPQIHAFSHALGHVPIIDPNPRGGEKLPFAPAEAQRFKERSASEHVNSLLKERQGGRRVRGAAKVRHHLMFGLVALTATALFARLG